jgi:hypothetical protein
MRIAGAWKALRQQTSFMATTPGVFEASAGGSRRCRSYPGSSFSRTPCCWLKDAVLLGAALWSLGESWRHLTTR